MDRDSLSELERRVADRMQHPDDPQVREWLDQNSLIYGALIGVAVVMVQPFLTAPSLDLTAAINVVAFSMAIPLLAALILANRQETFRGRRTRSMLVTIGQGIAQGAAFIGLVAAFLGMAIHSAGFWRLELDVGSSSEEPEKTNQDRLPPVRAITQLDRWWSGTASIRRPPVFQPGALPTELPDQRPETLRHRVGGSDGI